MVTAPPLQDMTVVVTRPAEQARELCRQLREAGARVRLFPGIDIVPPNDPQAARALLLANWPGADLAIFVSANAVRGLLSVLGRSVLPRGGPQVACLGPGTARALRMAGRSPDLLPCEGHDSESLLALPELNGDLGGRRVLIIRGDGGRELLAQVLRARGADVGYAQVYRRACPQPGPQEIAAVWEAEPPPDMVTATSPRIIDNLLHILPEGMARERLLSCQLVVVSPRMIQKLEAAGFRRAPVVASGAGNKALVEAMIDWRK